MVKYLILLIPVVLLSCSKNPELEYGFVDEQLQIYLDRFQIEGELRGRALDLSSSNIEAFIQPIFSNGVVGQCQHNEDRPNQVIVDQQTWNESNEAEKEFLIFHELGHCILKRDHLDNANPDGSCISIMHSVVGVCRNEFESRRSDYLDELFK